MFNFFYFLMQCAHRCLIQPNSRTEDEDIILYENTWWQQCVWSLTHTMTVYGWLYFMEMAECPSSVTMGKMDAIYKYFIKKNSVLACDPQCSRIALLLPRLTKSSLCRLLSTHFRWSYFLPNLLHFFKWFCTVFSWVFKYHDMKISFLLICPVKF